MVQLRVQILCVISIKKQHQGNKFHILNHVGPSCGIENQFCNSKFVHSTVAREDTFEWKKNKRPKSDFKRGPISKVTETASPAVEKDQRNMKVLHGKEKHVKEVGGSRDVKHNYENFSKIMHGFDKGYGSKSSMEVEAIGPNRLRFVENPKPPDPCTLQGGAIGNLENIENNHGAYESDDMEEIVAETPTMLQV